MRRQRTKFIHLEEFAGGGGVDAGRRRATGRPADVAVNHDLEAIAMHTMNHPEALHYCESVWKVDPLDVLERIAKRDGLHEMLRVAVASAWFSPDCKHFSKAKGGSLYDKRIRGLAYIILKWCGRGGGGSFLRGLACPLVLFLENVEEFITWGPLIAKRCEKTGRVVKCEVRDPQTKKVLIKGGTVAAAGEVVPYAHQWLVPDPKRAGLYFRRFIRTLEAFGGVCAWRELRACDFGAPTIRKRLFLICRFDGAPIVWPVATHGAPDNPDVIAGKLKPWRTAAECIDWHLPCPSIFLPKKRARRQYGAVRPLARSTMKRIAKGVERYVLKAKEPFIVNLTHEGARGAEAVSAPLNTVTGANRGEKALINPTLAPFVTEHANASHQRNFAANEPLRTQCGEVKGGHFALVAPLLARTAHGEKDRKGKKRGKGAHPVTEPLPTTCATRDLSVVAASCVKLRGDNIGYPMNEPAQTISAGGNHHGVVQAFIAQHNTGMVGHDPRTPFSTIIGKGCTQAVVNAAMMKYYGSPQDPQLGEPLHTVTTKDRFGIIETAGAAPPLTPELLKMARRVAKFLRSHGVEFEGELVTVGDFVIVDIGMRMFTARELYRAQSFPEDYIIERGMIRDEDTGEIIRYVKLTKTAQVKMCGNSVCPVMAEAIIAANPPRYPEEEEMAA